MKGKGSDKVMLKYFEAFILYPESIEIEPNYPFIITPLFCRLTALIKLDCLIRQLAGFI